MYVRKLSLLVISLCVGVCTTVSAASWDSAGSLGWHDATQARAAVQQAGMSLDQAVAMLQAKYNARVMRANSVEEGGRIVHYIRLMSADRSRVWTVRVDAASGREI